MSILEEQFPHVVKLMQKCWNDPDAFDRLMADLTVDKRGDRRGWPMDAWAEIVLLQEIHDATHGDTTYDLFDRLATERALDAWSYLSEDRILRLE